MSTYSDYARNAAAIMAESARTNAEARRQNGALIGQTIANVGQTVANAVGQIPAALKQAKIQSIFQQHGADIESAIPEVMKVDPSIGMDVQKRYHEAKSAALAYQEHVLTSKDKELEFMAARLGPVLDAEDEDKAQAAYTQGLATAKWAGMDISQFDPDVKKARPQIEALRTGTNEGREQINQQLKAIQAERERLKALSDAANVKADNERADAELEIHRQTAQSNAANVAADNARADKQLEEQRRHNLKMEARPVAGNASADPEDAESIADAIIRGEQPPEVTGLYRLAGPVRASLAKKGYNQAEAISDWRATQKHLATANGAQQTRLNQSIGALPDLLDTVDTLASKWKANAHLPILNRANLAAAKNGAYGADGASLANQLETQIADVVGDLGTVYMGGNSPTDHALKLAETSLRSDWDEKTIHDMVKLAKKNVQIRQNSIRNTGVQGASPNNPYAAPTQGSGDPLGIR